MHIDHNFIQIPSARFQSSGDRAEEPRSPRAYLDSLQQRASLRVNGVSSGLTVQLRLRHVFRVMQRRPPCNSFRSAQTPGTLLTSPPQRTAR